MGKIESLSREISSQSAFIAAYYRVVRDAEDRAFNLEEQLFRVEAPGKRGVLQVSPQKLRQQQSVVASELAQIVVLRTLRNGLTYRPHLDGCDVTSMTDGTEIGVSVKRNGSEELSIGYLVKGETVGLEEVGDTVRPYLSAMRQLATGPGLMHLPRR